MAPVHRAVFSGGPPGVGRGTGLDQGRSLSLRIIPGDGQTAMSWQLREGVPGPGGWLGAGRLTDVEAVV